MHHFYYHITTATIANKRCVATLQKKKKKKKKKKQKEKRKRKTL